MAYRHCIIIQHYWSNASNSMKDSSNEGQQNKEEGQQTLIVFISFLFVFDIKDYV